MPDWKPPYTAATAADPPQASTKAATVPTRAATTRAGSSAAAHTTSLTNALRPVPAAKKENRHASCASSPGRTTPRQANAVPIRPPRASPATTETAPRAAPTPSAVPDARATAPRQAASGTPLKRTMSGSVARPRETLSTRPYVTQASVNTPNAVTPRDRATYTPTAKLDRLEAAWSASPQDSRPARARLADRAGGVVFSFSVVTGFTP